MSGAMLTKLKKYLWIIILVIIAAFIAWRIASIPTERKAQRHFEKICAKIDSNEVVSATVYFDGVQKNIDVEGCLSKDDFFRLIPRYTDPPTPHYGALIIVFSDKSSVTLYNWESEYFFVIYKGRKYELTNAALFNRIIALHTEQ